MRLEYVALADIRGAERNPKLHQADVLETSIGRFGFVAPLVLDESTGRLVAGHGRVDALRAMRERGLPAPDRVRVREDGEWLVPVVRDVAFRTATEAQAYLLADNRLSEMGGWDDAGLAALLTELSYQDGLDGVGWTMTEIDTLCRDAARACEPEGASEPGEPAAASESVDPEGVQEVVMVVTCALDQARSLETEVREVALARAARVTVAEATVRYKAPFVWFGGKALASRLIWSRFGDVDRYIEPFAGSLAVLLGRPAGWMGSVEVVNDADGFVANAWRAILHDPIRTAHFADWPVNESDLHARHAWLVEQRGELVSRLEGDPDYCDPKIAGWWLWGVSQWIGGRFCSGDGSWVRSEKSPGVWALGEQSGTGRGVSRRKPDLIPSGVLRHSVVRGLPDAASEHCTLAHPGTGSIGLQQWLLALAYRLRQVSVYCGDWTRVLTPAVLDASGQGTCGVCLDPPYSMTERDDCYGVDTPGLSGAARDWCVEYGHDPRYRIALCGYEGEGHEVLEQSGWRRVSWTPRRGWSKASARGGANRQRERIWFSPACVHGPEPDADVTQIGDDDFVEDE